MVDASSEIKSLRKAATAGPRLRKEPQPGGARPHRNSRGTGPQQILPQAILAVVLGRRPIDPSQAARGCMIRRKLRPLGGRAGKWGNMKCERHGQGFSGSWINDGMSLQIAREWNPCRKRIGRTRSAEETAFPIPYGSRPRSVVNSSALSRSETSTECSPRGRHSFEEKHKKNAITVTRSSN